MLKFSNTDINSSRNGLFPMSRSLWMGTVSWALLMSLQSDRKLFHFPPETHHLYGNTAKLSFALLARPVQKSSAHFGAVCALSTPPDVWEHGRGGYSKCLISGVYNHNRAWWWIWGIRHFVLNFLGLREEIWEFHRQQITSDMKSSHGPLMEMVELLIMKQKSSWVSRICFTHRLHLEHDRLMHLHYSKNLKLGFLVPSGTLISQHCKETAAKGETNLVSQAEDWGGGRD